MKSKSLLLAIFSIFLISAISQAGHLRDNILIAAKMNGAQEIPMVATNGQGVASFMLNSTRDTMCVQVTMNGLSGPLTGIHIHQGNMGVNGPVIINLSPFIVGNKVSAVLTGTDLSQFNISKFVSGGFYINAHTSQNPNGEIRGQLLLETDYSFTVELNGNNEVPPVASSAYGVGTFILSKDLSSIKFNVVTQSLSGAITGAHLHMGAAGVAGGVTEDLSSAVNGNSINGTITAPSQMLVDSMMVAAVYLNVHTAANPNGEIRSQLMHNAAMLYFDAMLDGGQQVPSVATAAIAAAAIELNATMDTLFFDIVADGLSGSITGAHFHNAPVAANGSVELDLSGAITGNRIKGMYTGVALNTSLINKFLSGDIYLNIHTAMNPNGEVRGQVYRTIREGYTISMDGSQEVPSVSTSAIGSGIVSINRDQSNAHFMVVADGLSITGMHFHNNVAGQNGGVVYDLTSFLSNNAAYGYWRNSDTTPFLLANSVQFRNDGVYVNAHTSSNPNGEIRGQVLRGFQCSSISTAINNISDSPFINVGIYPNPAIDEVFIPINSTDELEAVTTIVNMVGEIIYTESFKLNRGNNVHHVYLNDLDTGFYFVKIQSDSHQVVKKFIKQ